MKLTHVKTRRLTALFITASVLLTPAHVQAVVLYTEDVLLERIPISSDNIFFPLIGQTLGLRLELFEPFPTPTVSTDPEESFISHFIPDANVDMTVNGELLTVGSVTVDLDSSNTLVESNILYDYSAVHTSGNTYDRLDIMIDTFIQPDVLTPPFDIFIMEIIVTMLMPENTLDETVLELPGPDTEILGISQLVVNMRLDHINDVDPSDPDFIERHDASFFFFPGWGLTPDPMSVPEPGTIAMMLVGLLGLGFSRYVQMQKQDEADGLRTIIDK